jgi:MutS domain V
VSSSPDVQRDTPAAFYSRRLTEIRIDLDSAVSRVSQFNLYATVLGGAAAAALYAVMVRGSLPIWAPFVLAAAALYVLYLRSKAQRALLQQMSLQDFYAGGRARLDRRWDDLDPGVEFGDRDHSYASDFDLFGKGSLYQLLCSARTQIGRETLADWMKNAAGAAEVALRQKTIAELRPRRDLPEVLALAGKSDASDIRPQFLKSWASGPAAFSPGLRLAALALTLAAVLYPLLALSHSIDLGQLLRGELMILGAQGSFALWQRDEVKRVLESVGPLSVEMPIVREMSRIVERESFVSEKLRAIQSSLARDGAASARIRRLERLLAFLSQRNNEMFVYVSFALLWTTQFTMAIDAWRARHGAELLEWLRALGEAEALISISTYSFEHPADPFPEIVQTGPLFAAEALGHPLLDEAVAIRNDVRLDSDIRFLIISGSNMSGKSTFLRAIGLNGVLCFLGAPVRCRSLHVSALSICAAIRVEDSLQDGRSNFMAEMQRLRRMIDIADKGELLFLADEIMSGTNSHDRRIATEWLVRALMKRGAIGAITTHDLALTEIATSGLPGRNVYFEDSGEGGAFHFDYKLRDGILQRSNALNIAHLLGIDSAAV